MLPRRSCILRFAVFCLSIVVIPVAMAYAENSVQEKTANSMIDSTKNNAVYEVYDLKMLYRRALKYSEKIKIGEEQYFIDSLLKNKARSVLIPRVDAFANHTRFDEKKSSGGMVVQPESVTSYGVTASQSFTLNGREIVAYQIAGDTIRRSSHDLDAVKEAYLFEVASSYFNLIRAVKAEKIAIANVERLQKYRDAVSTRLRLEDVPKTDLFRAEAELSSAKAKRLEATNNIELARAVLARVAMIEGEYSILLSDDDANAIPNVSLTAVKQAALEHRAEIKAKKEEQEIAEKQIRYTQGEYWPKLKVAGTYENVESEPGSSISDTDSLSLGLTLECPLFDGGLRKANVSEARSRKRQADLIYNDLVKQIDIEVEEAYLSFVTLKGTLDSLEDQFEYARENIESVSRQYQNGLADSLDVLDANTLLTTSENKLSEVFYRLQLAVLKLDRVKGTFLNGITETLNDNNQEEVNQ